MKPLLPFIIVVDLGHLLSLSRKPNGALELTERLEIGEGRQTIRELVTDNAGAFPNTGTNGRGNSTGERLPLKEELERRGIKSLADHINELCERQRPLSWGLAAPSEINSRLVEALDRRWTEKLKSNVHLDLTGLPPHEIAGHFDD